MEAAANPVRRERRMKLTAGDIRCLANMIAQSLLEEFTVRQIHGGLVLNEHELTHKIVFPVEHFLEKPEAVLDPAGERKE